MYYKIIEGKLISAPRNYILPDGRKVFNFIYDNELLAENGFTEAIIEGEATEEIEWYEQDGLTIIHHPAIVIEEEAPAEEETLTEEEVPLEGEAPIEEETLMEEETPTEEEIPVEEGLEEVIADAGTEAN